MRSAPVLGPERHRRPAFLVEVEGDGPGPAAHGTVLHVLLDRTAPGIHGQLDPGAAVRAPGGGVQVHDAVPEGDVAVQGVRYHDHTNSNPFVRSGIP